MIRYGSVCSGIEAATMAWHVLGWQPAFFSEIEAFPSAVLAHRYGSNMPGAPCAPGAPCVPGDALPSNGVPNLGDMTQFEEWPDHAIDLLAGGTPCQSYSLAGLRGGLDDERGNLMLTYAAIARRQRPRWLVWENVPGVLSSDGGRDFASLLGLLCGRRIEVPHAGWRTAGVVEGYHRAYGLAWRVLDAQYVRVDGYAGAVPQRRRRVFVVGYLGDWRRAAAVLFEREGLCGDSPPGRKAGQDAAATLGYRPPGGGGPGTGFDLDGGHGGRLITSTGDVAHCLNAGAMGRIDYETETMVAHALTGEGFDASEDGTGRGTPIVPVAMTLAIRGRDGEPDIEWRQDGTANAVLAAGGGRAGIGAGAVVHAIQAGAIQAGATRENPQGGPDGVGVREGIACTLEARPDVQAVQAGWAVRRLTPRECERLQGFPDDFTAIPHRGKPAADGPRYKALGNSMAVNVMRWIGIRIDMVEKLIASGRVGP